MKMAQKTDSEVTRISGHANMAQGYGTETD